MRTRPTLTDAVARCANKRSHTLVAVDDVGRKLRFAG
jgi:hypothetical protein